MSNQWIATASGTSKDGSPMPPVPLPIFGLDELSEFLFRGAENGFLPSGVVNASNLGVEPLSVELNIDEPFTLLPTEDSWAAGSDMEVTVTPF